MEHNQQYQLGPWLICPQTNSLKSKSDARCLDHKSMQLLLLLIINAGHTVTKDKIFEHVWKGKFVSNDILSVTMSKIRKALNDNAREPRFIKTLPNEGYVLVTPVNKIDNKPPKYNKKMIRLKGVIILAFMIGVLLIWFTLKPSEQGNAKPLNIKSIAVLPFKTLNLESETPYFSDGLSDTIINQLAQITQLKVISRDSSFTYRGHNGTGDIGNALQVEAVLTGSVQKIGQQTRVHVQIINTKSHQLLWSHTFDSDNKSSFQFQDDISHTVRSIIQPNHDHSIAQPQKINAQAYEWYLMGQYYWRQRTPTALNKAVTYFEHSLEIEPNYAQAHIGLAISYALLHTYGSWDELKAIEAALPHINIALALNPNAPLALATHGMILSDKAKAIGDFSLYQQAQSAFSRSLKLENNAITHLWYSTLLVRLGDQTQAVTHLNHAIELNPLSASLKRSLSYLLKSMGKTDSAQRIYQQAVNLAPNSPTAPFDSAKVNRHTQTSLLSIVDWQIKSPDLFNSCASIEVCEQQVLAYLSGDATDAAQALLNKMAPIHGHFVHTMNIISLSQQKQDPQVLVRIKNRLARLPYSRLDQLELASAYYRAAQFNEAKNTLIRLYPHWQNSNTLLNLTVTADNYSALMLYAASVLKLHDQNNAKVLLKKIDTYLKKGLILDDIQSQFDLAQVNAQLGNSKQALQYLTSALEMGWTESFNMQWWTLTNNHLLQPIHHIPQFQQLIQQHLTTRATLRKAIYKRLQINELRKYVELTY